MNKEDFLAGIVEKYPAELLNDRYMLETSMIGCFVNDLLLIDDAHLAVSDFVTHDGRFLFDILNTLRAAKCAQCDAAAMKTHLSEEIFEEVQARGGFNELHRLTYNIDVLNFESYLESLKKSNLLLKLSDYGFNITKKVKYHGKMIEPLSYFKKSQWTSEDISEWYSTLIDEASINVNNKVLEEERELIMGESFLDSLMSGESRGIPFELFDEYPEVHNLEPNEHIKCLSYFSKQVNGIPNGLTMIGGYSNVGKSTLVVQILLSMMHSDCKCLIITNEQRKKDFQLSFLLLLTKVYYDKCYRDQNEARVALSITKSKAKNGRLDEAQIAILRKMQQLWDSVYAPRVEFISMEDGDVDLAVKKMRVAIATRGVTTCVYDTFKIDTYERQEDGNMASYLKLVKDSRKFESLARKFGNVQIICTVQLAISKLGKLFLDSSVLSMSKQIKEVCDLMILLRGTYPEELDVNNKRLYCRPYRDEYNHNTGQWERNDNPDLKLGLIYRTIFIEKSRNSGNVSTDTGVAYLFSFDGDHGYWKDLFKCRPQHGDMDKRS